jgi:hypothetical protein
MVDGGCWLLGFGICLYLAVHTRQSDNGQMSNEVVLFARRLPVRALVYPRQSPCVCTVDRQMLCARQACDQAKPCTSQVGQESGIWSCNKRSQPGASQSGQPWVARCTMYS